MMAALYLTACESTAPNDGDGGSGKEVKSAPAIAVTPARLTLRVYAFAPQRDSPAQTLTVTNAGGGNLAWSASTNADWITLGRTAGSAPGGLQVRLNRAGMHLGVNGYRPTSLPATITLSSAGASNSPVRISVSVLISYLSPVENHPGGEPPCNGRRCN
jgi:hypothetical protein